MMASKPAGSLLMSLATSTMRTSVRGSESGMPDFSPSGPRFHSTTPGTSSATTTVDRGPSAASDEASVKPIPRPPTSTRVCARLATRSQASLPRASSEPCMRVLISGTWVPPSMRMTKSSPSR